MIRGTTATGYGPLLCQSENLHKSVVSAAPSQDSAPQYCRVCDNEAISMIYLLNVNEFNLTNQIACKFIDEGRYSWWWWEHVRLILKLTHPWIVVCFKVCH